MKTTLKSLAICTFFILLTGNLTAQADEISPRSTFKHAINICPIAPAFGIYALNYEYLITPKNGILARVEYEAVPKTYTDASIESSGKVFSLNYRRHLSGEMNALFLGVYTRYRIYTGDGELESKKFDFTLPSFTFGLNGGKRWVWNSGFNVTISMGYGISIKNREATPTDDAIEAALDQLEKDYDFISPFYGEISIGYAF